VIEDACHALGAYYQGKPIGHCRDMAVFSFHPVKSITTGEGGMVVTPHRHYYEKLRAFRSHGIIKDSNSLWEYEMQTLGYNYRMTDIQAALGLAQLSKLDAFVERRTVLAQRYRKALVNIQCQPELADRQSAWHLFAVCLEADRKKIFEKLVAANIRPQVHYIPVHLQPYYQTHLQTRAGDFPKAETYYEHCLSLPLYPGLTDEMQDYVIETLLRNASSV
jgi:dTDP-4-amino-4,6-dideoxygalactose transaminase